MSIKTKDWIDEVFRIADVENKSEFCTKYSSVFIFYELRALFSLVVFSGGILVGYLFL